MKIRGVIFDLDGTLVESLPAIAIALNRSLRKFGWDDHPEISVRGFIGDGARMLVTRALPPNTTEEDISRVHTAFGEEYARCWPEGTEVFVGMKEAIAILHAKGVRVAVLSNKPDPFTRAIVQALFPEGVFDAIVGQKPGVPLKPDPTSVLALVHEWGFAPDECVYVGDSVIDAETARSAGMKLALVPWGYHDEAALRPMRPDWWITKPEDLHAIAQG